MIETITKIEDETYNGYYIPSSVKSINTILWDCISLKKVVFSQKSQVTQIPDEICYSTNEKFKQGTVKKVTMTAASKKVSGLKSKQTYYVKVRAYKIDSKGGKYGSYSSVKKVKTK